MAASTFSRETAWATANARQISNGQRITSTSQSTIFLHRFAAELKDSDYYVNPIDNDVIQRHCARIRQGHDSANGCNRECKNRGISVFVADEPAFIDLAHRILWTIICRTELVNQLIAGWSNGQVAPTPNEISRQRAVFTTEIRDSRVSYMGLMNRILVGNPGFQLPICCLVDELPTWGGYATSVVADFDINHPDFDRPGIRLHLLLQPEQPIPKSEFNELALCRRPQQWPLCRTAAAGSELSPPSDGDNDNNGLPYPPNDPLLAEVFDILLESMNDLALDYSLRRNPGVVDELFRVVIYFADVCSNEKKFVSETNKLKFEYPLAVIIYSQLSKGDVSDPPSSLRQILTAVEAVIGLQVDRDTAIEDPTVAVSSELQSSRNSLDPIPPAQGMLTGIEAAGSSGVHEEPVAVSYASLEEKLQSIESDAQPKDFCFFAEELNEEIHKKKKRYTRLVRERISKDLLSACDAVENGKTKLLEAIVYLEKLDERHEDTASAIKDMLACIYDMRSDVERYLTRGIKPDKTFATEYYESIRFTVHFIKRAYVVIDKACDIIRKLCRELVSTYDHLADVEESVRATMEAFDRMALIAEARQRKIESEEKNFAIARAALAAALKRIAEIEAEGPREEFLVYMKQMVQSLDSEA